MLAAHAIVSGHGLIVLWANHAMTMLVGHPIVGMPIRELLVPPPIIELMDWSFANGIGVSAMIRNAADELGTLSIAPSHQRLLIEWTPEPSALPSATPAEPVLVTA